MCGYSQYSSKMEAMRWISVLLFTVSVVFGEKPAEDNKKRGLYDEGYAGQSHAMIINTHFADEPDSGYLKNNDYKGYQFALLSTVPVSQIPVTRPIPILPKQYYVVTRKVTIPVDNIHPYTSPYSEQYSVYERPSYPFKVPYGAPFPYQQAKYYVPKPIYGAVTENEDGIEYERPPIDERSAYQISSPSLQKSVPMPIQGGQQLYYPKPYYVRPEKEVYAPGKAIAYTFGVPGQQLPNQQPLFVPVIEKNVE